MGLLQKKACRSILGASVLTITLLSCSSQNSKRPLALGKPVSSCTFSAPSATVRLYVDEGTLAIGTTDYTITYQDATVTETIIFDSVSSPYVEDIYCADSMLLFDGKSVNTSRIQIERDWITKELIKSPLLFYKSKLASIEYANRVASWPIVFVPTLTPIN